MKRLIISLLILSCFFSLSAVVGQTDDDSLQVYAYKRTADTSDQTWVRVLINHPTTGKFIGPWLDVLLGDGSNFVSATTPTDVSAWKDAFVYKIIGNYGKPLTVSFDVGRFTQVGGTAAIDGWMRMKPNAYSSSILTSTTIRDNWPMAIVSGPFVLSTTNKLSARCYVETKAETATIWNTTSPTKLSSECTRSGVIQVILNANDYDAAPSNTDYSSTVIVTVTVN